MAGIDGFGADFIKYSGTNTTAVGGVTSISGPDMEGADLDVSDMDSPNGFREFIPGIVDGGEASLELNWQKTQQTTLHGYWRSTGSFRVVWSDGSKLEFDGYMKSLGTETPFDDKVSASATFKVSGKPTFTGAA